MRLVSEHHNLLNKIRDAFADAAEDTKDEASRNLNSSRGNAVYVRTMPSGRARIQTDLPYGLIRQWGGTIRPRNRSGYLHFRTRAGNWVRTKTSRQRGTQWLSRAGLTFGNHMMKQLLRRG